MVVNSHGNFTQVFGFKGPTSIRHSSLGPRSHGAIFYEYSHPRGTVDMKPFRASSELI